MIKLLKSQPTNQLTNQSIKQTITARHDGSRFVPVVGKRGHWFSGASPRPGRLPHKTRWFCVVELTLISELRRQKHVGLLELPGLLGIHNETLPQNTNTKTKRRGMQMDGF